MAEPTRRVWVAAGMLVVVVVAVYAPTIGFQFVNFDDPENITESGVRAGFVLPFPGVTVGQLRDQVVHQVVWAFTTVQAGYWAPVTWLSHMLDCEIFGLWAGGHHLVNLVLHAANTGLVFVVLDRMTGRAWASLFVAAVFALHPLRVESVAWVTERKDVLSTFFWLLTMLAYERFVRTPRRGTWIPVVVTFALGLMAKPMLVSLPFVLLALDWWPLGRLRDRATAWACVREKAVLFGLAAVASVTILVAQSIGGAMVALDRIPIRARLVNAAVSYLRYLGMVVWPADLAVFYPWVARPVWQGAAAATVLVGMSAAIASLARRRPYLAVGWWWYVVTLLPVIGLVQVGMQSHADRFLYVPLIGLALAVTWAVVDVVGGRPGGRAVLVGAAGAIVVACTIATALQLRHWRDSVALFTRALAVTSGNYLAHNNLGEALAREGKRDEAVAHYTEAARLNPRHPESRVNLGNALARSGRPEEAMVYYREALALRPKFPAALNGLGVALAAIGDLRAAIVAWKEARKLRPAYIEPYVNIAGALARTGELEEAAGNYQLANLFNPGDVRVVLALGDVRARQGKLDEAIRWYRDALGLEPTSADAYASLGVALATLGRFQEATAAYGEALRYRPGWGPVAGTLAWIRATAVTDQLRDGEHAIRLAEGLRAGEGGDSAEVHDILAAAYAEGGRWPEAVATAEQARTRAAAVGNAALIEKLDDRLRNYRAGRPTRDTTIVERPR